MVGTREHCEEKPGNKTFKYLSPRVGSMDIFGIKA
jgi:hypothetical protein